MVQIVTDDRPFLVDSVTMEVIRHGWSIREVFHPQFLVRRDVGGTLRGIVGANEAGKDPELFSESWMHLEILPPSRPEHPETLLSDLEHGLLEVLRLVEEVVQDWSRMRTRSVETITMLPKAAVSDGRQDEAALATELLEWLNDNHFTFLGYRQYRLVHEDRRQPIRARAVDRSGHPAGRHRSARRLPCPAAPRLLTGIDDHHQGQREVAGSPAGVP